MNPLIITSNRTRKYFSLILLFCLITLTQVKGNVHISTGNMAVDVSADYAANSLTPAYTNVGNIVITEESTGDFAVGSMLTLILSAPSGWQFQPGLGSVTVHAGMDITYSALDVTSAAITLTYTVTGASSIDGITISGTKIIATDGANIPALGRITRSLSNPGTGVIAGADAGVAIFGSFTQTAGSAAKLVITLPGETFTDGETVATSGNTGTVVPQTANITFNMVGITATDQFFNVVASYTGPKTIAYVGAASAVTPPVFTTAVEFDSGRSITSLSTILKKAETITLTATDGVISGPASSALTINGGSVNHFQIISALGTKIGTQIADSSFFIRVIAEDAENNISGFSGRVNITSTGILSAGAGVSAAFTDGILDNYAVRISNSGIFTISATNIAGTQNGTSNMFNVIISPDTRTTVQWLGLTPDWHTATNWQPQIVPSTCNVNVIIPSEPVGGNFPELSAASACIGDITVQDNARLTLNMPLRVTGNWAGGTSGFSTVTGTGTVQLTGNLQQLLGNKTKFAKLNLNNLLGGRLAPAAEVHIEDVLELEFGNLNTEDATLRFLSPSSTKVAVINNFSPGYIGIIRGNITVERGYDAPTTANSFNQHFMGSPVNEVPVSQFGAQGKPGFIQSHANCYIDQQAAGSPYGTMFEYDETNGATCAIESWKTITTGNTVVGKGYSVAKQGAGVLSLTGLANLSGQYMLLGLQNSNWVNKASYKHIAPYDTLTLTSGWHLVSNPYLGYLNLDLYPSNSEFGAQVQVWETTGPYAGSYQPRMAGSGDALIAPFQAYMIHKISPLSPPATYTIFASDLTLTETSFYRKANQNELKIFAENTGTGIKDVTRVAFNTEATLDFDANYDANKLFGNGGRHTLYTQNKADEFLSINTLSSIEQRRDIDLGLRPGTTGTFKLSFEGIGSFDPTTYIYLEDKETRKVIDVRQNPEYSFTMSASDAHNRFTLHFTPPTEITVNKATCINKGSISAKQPSGATWAYAITDATQNTVATGTLTHTTPIALTVDAGTYTLTLTDSKGYSVVKNLEVEGALPVTASISASTTSANIFQSITFTGSGDNATNFEWNFGDGNITTTSSNINHIYTSAGTYTVVLTTSNKDGCIATGTQTITVSDATTDIIDIKDGAINVWSNDNQVNIDFTKTEQVQAHICIYDMLGRELCNEKFTNKDIYSRQFAELSTTYVIVKVKNNDKDTITKKLFISDNR